MLIGDMPHELSHLVVELSVVPGLCEDDRRLVQLLPRLMLCSKDIAANFQMPPELDQLRLQLLNLRLQPQALAHCLELAHRLDFPCYVRDRRLGRLLRREQKRGDENPFPIAFDSHWNGTSSASPLKSDTVPISY